MVKLRLDALALFFAVFALSGCDDGPPASVDSGFRLSEHAFTFDNFTGDGRLEMTGDLAARMFGADAVCIDGALPCTPTGAALGWIETVNEQLAEGRSEGMAILSLLLMRGDIDPEELGGANAAALRLDGNPELQAELAYWSATQYVAGVVNQRRVDASEVIPFLAEALAPDATERYRLGVAVREADGSYAHGHALVPIGYYEDEDGGGLYWLRVYDGNVPNREGLVRIDTKNGTWRYEVPAGEGTLVYEGTPANDNPLTFAPVSERLGMLPAPFAADSPHLLLSHSSEVGVTVEVGGETAGVNGGEVDESAGRVTPLFSSCSTCRSRGWFLYDLRDKPEGDRDMTLTISGAAGRTSAEGSASIVVHQPGRSTSVSGIDGTATGVDTFSVTEDGDVSYTNRSGTDLTIRSGSGADRVSLATDGPTDEVRITRGDDGTVTMDVDGAPAGTTVTLVVGGLPDQIRYEYVSDGTDQRISVNPDTGVVQVGDMVFDGACTNGYQNGDESDVDCGGSCDARCSAGQYCRSTADCVDGAICPEAGPRICAAPGCSDGILDGEETEIDCGGSTCSPCVANFEDSPACNAGSDCDTGRCTDGTCQANTRVYLNVYGLSYGTTVTVDATFDGTTTERTVTSTANFGATRVDLGAAYEYSLAVGTVPPDVSGCTFRTTPTGTATSYSVSYDLDCRQDGNMLVLDVRTLPAGSVFELTRDLDGTVDMVSVNATGQVPFGVFRTSARLEVVRQPDPVMTADGLREVACDFFYWDTSSVTTVRTVSFDDRYRELYARIECRVTDTPAMGMDGGMADGGTSDGGVDMGTDAGPPTCTFDTDCANADCYCGASSGNCAGSTGQCGAGKAVIHVPTTDGVAASGSFTVPSGCSQVHVQAWGAAGGNSGSEDPFSFSYVFQRRGGSGGYVTGQLSAADGDVFTAWVGQGGTWNNTTVGAGTASIGSNLGTAASGGASSSNEDFIDYNAGASGGGLTSVQQTGSATRSFVIPGGGGAGFMQEGQSTGSAGAGTGSMASGADGTVAESQGGGGAGDPGGVSGMVFGDAGQAGGYGALPAGLTSMDGAGDGDPANTTAPDRSLCVGLRSGDPPAGSSSISFEEGGDGCVVLRCVPE